MSEDPICSQKVPYVKTIPAGTYFYCTCGRTDDQPYCDGNHRGTGFAPQKVELTEETTVAFCGCRQSGNGHQCDGSHTKL